MIDYCEPFRPQFHFTPQKNWMNDPNGLVYYDGYYHLFYQYYPDDIIWGPMHWGHAISIDLINWKHKPIALFPDEHGYIFSGSTVVDINNSTEFGSKKNPPLVAVFTYHSINLERSGTNNYQTQGIAFSLDKGNTWIKYANNPVIENTGIKDFRDPKVFFHNETNQWVMALVAGDHVKFFNSSNLKNWKYLSDFGKEFGAHGGVWECPDLFKLKISNTNEEKWVLLISINPGAPNGGSGTQYFIGNFDGKRFTVEHEDIKWIDLGSDNYAAITYNNEPNNKRILMGWMSNWLYGQKTPTKTWRGAMTLPRELSLTKENNTVFLRNVLITSFDKQIRQILEKDYIYLKDGFKLEHTNFNQAEIRFDLNLSKGIRIELENNKKEILIFEIDSSKKEMILDRKNSGIKDFEEQFAKHIHILPYYLCDKVVDIRIILDWSSVEIFIDQGKYVMTEQIFPTEFYNKLQISSKEKVRIENFKLNHIKSIWNDE